MKKLRLEQGFLFAITIVAILIRLVNLSNTPIGFSDDEAAFGYNAYSILKTGRDEWGKFLPIRAFQSFGDYKLPIYFYLTSASISVFGFDEFAVRFPTAIFGVFSVIATYFLIKKLFNLETALMAAFLLTISPFHVFASRHALESAVPIFFNLLGIIFFLMSFKKPTMIQLSLLVFALNLYIYRSTWIFVPIYLLSFFLLFKSELLKNLRNFTFALGIFIVLAIPIFITAISPKGTSRFRQIGITSNFNMIGVLNDVNTQRGLCRKIVPTTVCRIEYNKYFAVFTKYVSNYVSHYSPQLLFISGSQDAEQMVKGRGFLYFIELPFILIALVFLVKRYKSIQSRVLLPWMLIYPLASASAGFETPGRQAIAMPIWEIFAAVGFLLFYKYIAKFKGWYLRGITMFIFSSILIFQFGKFFITYFVTDPQSSTNNFRYGYKELFSYLQSQEKNYNKFIISDKIDQSHQYIFQLFFQKIEPNYFQQPSYVDRHLNQDGWVVVTRIGNYHYVTSVPDLTKYPPKTLIAVTKGEISSSTQPVNTINYPNGDTIFKIYDVDSLKFEMLEKQIKAQAKNNDK